MIGSQMAARNFAAEPEADFDAIVIGAGVSGLYQLYRLRQLGLRVRVLETGTGVGGTWYWNRYPGARFDSESYTYGYSFSPELLEEWSWAERFSGQPENERYLNYVADKFDLRRDIQFNSRVAAAHYQENTRGWDVILEDGRRYRTRFLVTAIGVLSAPTMPRIAGIDTFKGQSCHTHYWPKEPVNFAGKRVAVIGTGATAVQTIQEVAKTVGHLTVFQRTPQWCAPLHNDTISADEMRRIRASYPEIFARCAETPGCFIHAPDPRATHEVTPAGARGVLGEALRRARLRHLAGQFPRHTGRPRGERADLRFHRAQDPPAGQGPGGGREADPEEPRLRHPPRAARDPLLRGLQPAQRRARRHQRDADRAHHARPASRPATPNTNSTSSSTPPASTRSPAAFDRIDIRGVDGCRLKDKWKAGPQTYLGILVEGFPNLLMVMGPHAGLGNFPRAAEYSVDWVTGLVRFARDRGLTRIEATAAGVAQWTDHVKALGEGLLDERDRIRG